MAAMYQVKFNSNESLIVYSADTKSSKLRDRQAAYRKARLKAEAKWAKMGKAPARAVSVMCVG